MYLLFVLFNIYCKIEKNSRKFKKIDNNVI